MAAPGPDAARIDSGPLKGLVDPFAVADNTSSTEPRRPSQRYSAFDSQVFSQSQAGASPGQAKAALEAHMTETDRRLEEASRLGTALVAQRQELAARLKEVDTHPAEEEIGPELRQKLVDVEKEFNELGRDSARVFLAPKSQGAAGGPLSEVHNAASPTKFSSQATDSPSKVTVPSRKQRNQPSSRVHDIEFATEISTSLLAQVRQLQGVLAERDEALRTLTQEKSQIEVDQQGLTQRVRNLNDSEQHYKDENWNLHTKTHDLIAAQKDSATREQRLQQSLALVASEKSTMQREMEELRAAHGKLTDDHAAFRKAHDVDVAGMKKHATLAEGDRGAMQRQIDDLTAQNQELANAVASHVRGGNTDLSAEIPSDPEDYSLERDENDPSPPPSPSKGGRNSMLESETLKSSLTHAHRMIQTLKTNVHREKSEKIELKRLLQETRDELELRRTESGATTKRAKTKAQDSKKQGKIGQLGAGRSSTTEVEVQDGDWEEHHGQLAPAAVADLRGESGPSRSSNYSDVYQTADETEDAYETAQEKEDTDGFQTGLENRAHDSSDDLTETEDGPTKPKTSKLIKPTPPSMDKRASYLSTASTTDGAEDPDEKTPVQSAFGSIRNRFRLSRGSRRSRVMAAESVDSTPGSNKDSPASFRAQKGQSLAAELGDFDDESMVGSAQGTPSRSRTTSRGATPARDTVIYSSEPPVPKLPTSDAGVMTETAAETRPPPVQLELSAVSSVEMEPASREHVEAGAAEAASAGMIGSVLGWAIGKRQSTPHPEDTQEANGTPRETEPLSEVSGNATKARDWSDKLPVERTDQGSQTILSSEQMDSLLAAREHRGNAVGGVIPLPVPGGKVVSPTSEGAGSPRGLTARDVQPNSRAVRRPPSSGSARGRGADIPPLPMEHRQAIAAASSNGQDRDSVSMGPPTVPASAYRTANRKPQTPTDAQAYGSSRGQASSTPRGGARFSARSLRSRQSSVSSFESELDARFNIRADGSARTEVYDGSTDPRMIQAITQTMIGEYLWKYTRKAGRGNMSDKRHRRFFWVHPYTRTLYWSDQDPSTAGRAQLKAKSVQIEAVRVVADDNPLPPGLHRKSLMVVAPGRDIKFTATTGQRHETWFNALSYLLLRGGPDAQYAENYTPEDVAEFNPGGAASVRQSTQSRVSLSTYNSRPDTRRSRASSREGSVRRQALAQSFGGSFAPRLQHADKDAAAGGGSSVGSRLSGLLLRPHRASTTASGKAPARPGEASDFYDARVVNDSAEDVRQHMHHQDQHSDQMENVRACCDGKHDVGSLSRHHPSLHNRMARGSSTTSASASGLGTGTGTGTLTGVSQGTASSATR